ncbi:MAG: hypothetical protein GX601_07730, partial [Anaerolineales bacterium]|nr:hypothetical protein [Anaerolineales bacterium]
LLLGLPYRPRVARPVRQATPATLATDLPAGEAEEGTTPAPEPQHERRGLLRIFDLTRLKPSQEAPAEDAPSDQAEEAPDEPSVAADDQDAGEL